MADDATTVGDLRRAMQAFVDEREWQSFHTPKNLVMSLTIEAAELMEHYQWCDSSESLTRTDDPARRQAVGEEIADVCCYLLSLVNALGIDLSEAVTAKLIKNRAKYPVEPFRGRYEVSPPE
jgi:NTP pyrophosphatase (non-canonical NTP hydrolase)